MRVGVLIAAIVALLIGGASCNPGGGAASLAEADAAVLRFVGNYDDPPKQKQGKAEGRSSKGRRPVESHSDSFEPYERHGQRHDEPYERRGQRHDEPYERRGQRYDEQYGGRSLGHHRNH